MALSIKQKQTNGRKAHVWTPQGLAPAEGKDLAVLDLFPCYIHHRRPTARRGRMIRRPCHGMDHVGLGPRPIML